MTSNSLIAIIHLLLHADNSLYLCMQMNEQHKGPKDNGNKISLFTKNTIPV